MATPKAIHMGVLILPPVQLLDLSPIDLFGMLTKEYLEECRLPKPLVDKAIPITISYISPEGPSSIAELTANAALRITHSISSFEVEPGKLDVLLIPGPPPFAAPSEEGLEFVRRHVEAGVDLLTVCTGIFVAGYAGVLDGKSATGPRELIGPLLKPKFGKVHWVEKRWEIDGRVWTAGGITNGQDMVAEYIKKRWPGPVGKLVCNMADVGDRGQEYSTGRASQTTFWVWNLFLAWLGVGKAKRA